MNLDGVEKFSYFKEKKPQNKKNKDFKMKTIIFIIIFLLIGFLFLFYFLFNGDQFFNQDKSIDLKIDLSDNIIIGQEFNFKVLANNQEKNDAIDVELFINFPENYQYFSSQPECSEISSRGCLIKIDRIKSGEAKEVQLKGLIFGLPESKINVKAEINFQLDNFSSWFQKDITKEIILKEYPFEINTSSPQTLSLSEVGDFSIKIKNPNNQNINSRIIITAPSGFIFNSFEPVEKEKKENQIIWEMNFNGNEEKEIKFKGSFTENDLERKITLQFGILNSNNEFFLQSEKEITVKIDQPGLVLGLKVDDNFLEDLNKNFGDKIELNLSYKNIGQEIISNPKLSVIINPSYLIVNPSNSSWQWIQGNQHLTKNSWQVKESGNLKNLIFSNSEISEINPGEEGEINFSLKVKNYEELANFKSQNLKISLVGQIEATIFRQQPLIFTLKSNEMNVKINSKVKLEVEAKYYSDEGLKIGNGPLPPEVNSTTSYVIFLRPTNTSNELKNITISAILPDKVSWMGEAKSSSGNLFFDSNFKKITWKINDLPIYTGNPYSYLEASFKIGLTPSEIDRGQVLPLLEKINLLADDTFTGQSINLTVNNLDTNLMFDDIGQGKGIIQ